MNSVEMNALIDKQGWSDSSLLSFLILFVESEDLQPELMAFLQSVADYENEDG